MTLARPVASAQIQGHLNAHWDRHRLIAAGRIAAPLQMGALTEPPLAALPLTQSADSVQV
jgi:hypothetical protein